MKCKMVLFFACILSVAGIFAQENTLYHSKQHITAKDTLQYRILYPEGFTEEQVYPVIFFLHGAGERGSDNEKQLAHGSKLFVQDSIRKNFPAIVVFPQCPKEDYWASVDVDRSNYPIALDFKYKEGPTKALSSVLSLLDLMLAQPYTKKDQVYIMGLSMGGMGTYEMMYRRPDTFAAAIAICGAGEANSATNYAKKIPVWAFHGSEDNVVNPQESLLMVSQLLQGGGLPQFTLYDHENHNSWDRAFAEPQLLPWLFSHIKTLDSE